MGELVIQTHNFETAKNRLRDFSQKLPKDLEIDLVETDGGFLGLFDRNVTGRELNYRLSTIQDHLISLKDIDNRTIKEFNQVYKALEALDKDYIQAILVSIKATEKTSERLEKDNERINKLQGNQTKTLGILLDFKKKIDAYKHLGDIDRIWTDCQKWHEEIPAVLDSLSDTIATVEANSKNIGAVRESLGATSNCVAQITHSLDEQIERIKALVVFVEGMEEMAHLRDIDTMFDSITSANDSLIKLCDNLETVKRITDKHQQKIERALSFVETASHYEHLKDIDAIWGSVEEHGRKLNMLAEQDQRTGEAVAQNRENIAKLNQGLSAIAHLNDVDNLWTSNETHSEEITALQEQSEDTRSLIQHNKELADQSLFNEKSRIDTLVQNLNKKIQYAYWIAGGSMALAIIELLVILLG